MITNTRPEHWKYISEGGATIVFSYTGPSNPQFDGMALRLRKSVDSDQAIDVIEFLQARPSLNDPIIEYQHTCMERLIPREHLTRLESVRLDKEWLESLADLCHVDRSVYRSSKDGIDVTKQQGVLATDLVGGGGLSVEIKVRSYCLLYLIVVLNPSSAKMGVLTISNSSFVFVTSSQDTDV